MALATTDAILADAIDAITIAVGLTTVDVDATARETTNEIVVHAIAIGVHRQDATTVAVATTC